MSDEAPPSLPAIEYPTAYTFKVMGKSGDGFAEQVRTLFEEVLGTELSGDAVAELPSRQGNYVSLSVTVDLTSEEQRRAVYARLHAEPRIVYYL